MQFNSRGVPLQQQVLLLFRFLRASRPGGEQWVSGHFFPCLVSFFLLLQRSDTVGNITPDLRDRVKSLTGPLR